MSIPPPPPGFDELQARFDALRFQQSNNPPPDFDELQTRFDALRQQPYHPPSSTINGDNLQARFDALRQQPYPSNKSTTRTHKVKPFKPQSKHSMEGGRRTRRKKQTRRVRKHK